MLRSRVLLYIINHVFLPSKLPQKDDEEGGENEALLLECEQAWEMFQHHLLSEGKSNWASCSGMLRKMREMRDMSGAMIPHKLEEMLKSMSRNGRYPRANLIDIHLWN